MGSSHFRINFHLQKVTLVTAEKVEMHISSVISKMIYFVSGLYQWGIISFSCEAGDLIAKIYFLVVVAVAVFKIIDINAMPSSFNPRSCQEMKFLPLYHALGRKYWCVCVSVCACMCLCVQRCMWDIRIDFLFHERELSNYVGIFTF